MDCFKYFRQTLKSQDYIHEIIKIRLNLRLLAAIRFRNFNLFLRN